MIFEQLSAGFIYSRRFGLRESGAKRKCSDATLANYEDHLKVIVEFMQNERNRFVWNSVDTADVRAFVEHVSGNEAWSESTRLTYLRSFRTLLKFIDADAECREAGLQGYSQFSRLLPAIGGSKRRESIPSPLGLKKWSKEFDTDNLYGYRNHVAFCLWLDTGIRLSELSLLPLAKLQLDNSLVYVDGKSGPRSVRITDKTVRLLKAWLKMRDGFSWAGKSDYLFVGHYAANVGRSGFGQIFRKMRKANPKLPKLTAHMIRHYFATHYLQNGGNLQRLRITLGHSDIRTTSQYLHLALIGGEEMKSELERASPLKALDSIREKK